MRPAATSLMLLLTAASLGTTAPAEAVTIRDIVELSRAGLAPEIIVALIEADASVFDLDTPQILDLQADGVSDSVIVAMIRTRLARATEIAEAPTITPAGRDGATRRRDERRDGARISHGRAVRLVPVPVLVPSGPPHRRAGKPEGAVPAFDPTRYSSFGTGFRRDGTPTGASRSKPVYWGWGGTLRPGAWGQPVEADHRSRPDGP